MQLAPTRWIFIFGFLLQGVLSYAQSSEWPVDEWIKKLSSKKEDSHEFLGSVAYDLDKLDTADRCLALSILDEQGPDSKLFRFRLTFIKASHIETSWFVGAGRRWTHSPKRH
jgi:hypothetical protein